MPDGRLGPCFCSVEGCERPVKARRMCMLHYQRWYKAGGRVRRYSKSRTPMAKLAEHSLVDEATGCIEWQWGLSDFGYGRIRLGKRRAFAHVIAYEQLVSPIPAGWDVDHLCRNPKCWNIEHLQAVPHRVNLMRGPTTLTRRNTLRTHPNCLCWDVEAIICPDHGVIVPDIAEVLANA